MNALLHVLNIGTLATWLSVAGFGTVGVLLPAWHSQPAAALPDELETIWVAPDINLGAETPADSAPASSENSIPEIPEILPAPPELPEIAELAPLPDIPDLPTLPQPSARLSPHANSRPPAQATTPRRTAAPPRSATGTPGSSRPGASGGSSTAAANASRLAAGRMPAPSYPSEARRKGQTGTVVIEFTVDSSGRVISAYAKSLSPWPLLNEEAVRTVRRWKFPPGGVMKLQRPIVFQLR
ncbi:MAG: TonB family protein [Akkermansiaceae bacterium]